MRSLKPQRVAVALCPEDDAGSFEPMERFVMEAFRGVWERDEDPDDPAVIEAWLRRADLAPSLVARADEPAVKQSLIARTQDALEAGVFGAPTFRVRGALFWGQDRVSLVERAVEGWVPPAMD